MSKHSNGSMVVEKARDLYSASSKLAKKGSSRIKSFLHGQPVMSVLTGVAAGFILAMAFRLRK